METIESFAARLNGREYRKEITAAEEAEAKALNFVVAFGASDDLLELRGVIDDECGAWEGTTKRFREHALSVKAEWCPRDLPDTSWRITANQPFAPFNVMEGGEVYCVGAVIALTRAGGA